MGCYRDNPDIQIKSLEGMDSLLNDSYRLRTDAIQKCAIAALVRGFTAFAVQDGGMCVSDKYAYFFHEFAVKSENCKSDGKGGNMANQVYYLNSTLKGMDRNLKGKVSKAVYTICISFRTIFKICYYKRSLRR